MKRLLRPEAIAIAASLILLAIGYFVHPSAFAAEQPGKSASAPKQSGMSRESLPEEAGGLGVDWTIVDHPDQNMVIHTWLSNGQPKWVVGFYEWNPLRSAPKTSGALATEIRKLDTQMGYAGDQKRLQEAEELAKWQIRMFEPTPEQRKQKATAKARKYI